MLEEIYFQNFVSSKVKVYLNVNEENGFVSNFREQGRTDTKYSIFRGLLRSEILWQFLENNLIIPLL